MLDSNVLAVVQVGRLCQFWQHDSLERVLAEFFLGVVLVLFVLGLVKFEMVLVLDDGRDREVVHVMVEIFGFRNLGEFGYGLEVVEFEDRILLDQQKLVERPNWASKFQVEAQRIGLDHKIHVRP